MLPNWALRCHKLTSSNIFWIIRNSVTHLFNLPIFKKIEEQLIFGTKLDLRKSKKSNSNSATEISVIQLIKVLIFIKTEAFSILGQIGPDGLHGTWSVTGRDFLLVLTEFLKLTGGAWGFRLVSGCSMF